MDKDEFYNKLKPIIDAQNRTTTLTIPELEEWWKNHPSIDTTSTYPNILLFPTAIKIAARTIGGDGVWVKSKKQQLKENRLNKFRELEGEEPNVILPNDEYVEGIVSVKPLSAPRPNLLKVDYKYSSKNENQ
jgi:hypothetical protein